MKESTSGHDLTIDLVLDVFLGQLLYKNMRFWYTPTKFTSSPLKIDGWETTFLLGPGPFSGGMFNFRRVMWYASPWRLCATWLQGPEGVWHPRPSAETLVGKVQILKRSYFYREQITFEGLQTQQILFIRSEYVRVTYWFLESIPKGGFCCWTEKRNHGFMSVGHGLDRLENHKPSKWRD